MSMVRPQPMPELSAEKSVFTKKRTAYQRALALFHRITKPAWLALHPTCQFLWCGIPCGSKNGATVHHKKGRGKYLNDIRYFLTTCTTHHAYIHKNPKWSYEHGWLIKRHL